MFRLSAWLHRAQRVSSCRRPACRRGSRQVVRYMQCDPAPIRICLAARKPAGLARLGVAVQHSPRTRAEIRTRVLAPAAAATETRTARAEDHPRSRWLWHRVAAVARFTQLRRRRVQLSVRTSPSTPRSASCQAPRAGLQEKSSKRARSRAALRGCAGPFACSGAPLACPGDHRRRALIGPGSRSFPPAPRAPAFADLLATWTFDPRNTMRPRTSAAGLPRGSLSAGVLPGADIVPSRA